MITQSSLTDKAYMAYNVSTPLMTTRLKTTHLVYCLFDLFPIGSPLDEFVDTIPVSKSGYRVSDEEMTDSSGVKVPPYLVTSLTIWARSLASLTIYTCPSIFTLAKSSVIRCCLRDETNAWYALRSAMIWKPPLREMIWRFRCRCKILQPVSAELFLYGPERGGNPLLQSNSDFLVEYLENLFGCTSLKKIAVHLQTSYGLFATLRSAEVHRLAIVGVVLARTSLDHNDVLHLGDQPYTHLLVTMSENGLA